MNRLFSLIILPIVVFMSRSAYSQTVSSLLRQDGAITSFQPVHAARVEASTVRSRPLVEQTTGGSGAGSVVVRKPQAETTHETHESRPSVIQREHGGRIYADTVEIATPAPAPAPAPAPVPKIQKSRIAIAWEQYNSGNISKAATIFRSLSTLPEMAQEASYGLVRCYMAGKESAKALPVLEQLVAKRFRMNDTLPELLGILLEHKDFQKAAEYVVLLGEKERSRWKGMIDNGIFHQRYARLQESGSMSEAVDFANDYEGLVKQCGTPDIFNNLADFFVQNHKTDEAALIYLSLLSCTEDENMQLGILYSLKSLRPHRELLELAELKKSKALPEHKERLETFMVELLYGLLDSDPENAGETALAVLKIRPTDQIALAALGWWHFNRQHYDDAYECFWRLSVGPSKKTEHVEGMIYSLIKLERLDEALTVARLNGNDKRIAAMAKDITLNIHWNRVSSLPSDSPEIETLAKNILLIRPDNEEIRVVRAWWYYNRREFGKAYQDFNALYTGNPGVKGYSYGLASTLLKLMRYEDAAMIASTNKQYDERLVALETNIYLERAKSAYDQKRYQEAELYFGKVLGAGSDDENVKKLLESSRYRQTPISKVLSPIVGLSGYTWGSLSHDLQGSAGTGATVLVNQGIDWVRLPWDMLLRSYGELRYRTRSEDSRYYDIAGQAVGVELNKSVFRLGAEYVSEQYTRQSKSNGSAQLFLAWYSDWHKKIYDKGGDAGWLNIQSLSGSTFGKLSHDLGGNTGSGISGYINQGIDWLTLPGSIMLNSFVEYRTSLRTRDNLYYNEHGPVVGTELQRLPFKAGIEYYWENDTERHLFNPRVSVYLKWYYGWDLKPNK